MKPITYWVQTPAIEALCETYGSTLEQLTQTQRLAIASSLLLRVRGHQPDQASHERNSTMEILSSLTKLDDRRSLLLAEAILAQINFQPAEILR